MILCTNADSYLCLYLQYNKGLEWFGRLICCDSCKHRTTTKDLIDSPVVDLLVSVSTNHWLFFLFECCMLVLNENICILSLEKLY